MLDVSPLAHARPRSSTDLAYPEIALLHDSSRRISNAQLLFIEQRIARAATRRRNPTFKISKKTELTDLGDNQQTSVKMVALL
jgi:hypothetical protein